MFVAATIVPGDTGVHGLTGEAVSRVTFRTGAAYLFPILRTPGSFSTTTVPELTHVCRYRQKRRTGYSETKTMLTMGNIHVCVLYVKYFYLYR